MKSIYAIVLSTTILMGCATQRHSIPCESEYVEATPVVPAHLVIKEKKRNKELSWAWYHVKKHDCLWNISKKLYSTPFMWVEIYKLNRMKIKDPHWIYPKQQFIYQER